MTNIDIFESARYRQKIENLPEEYYVDLEKNIKIKTKYLYEIGIGDKIYTTNTLYSVFDEIDFNAITMSLIELKLFLAKNFKNVDYVLTWNMSLDETFYLEKKKLHNTETFSYEKNDKINQKQERKYFIHGKEIPEAEFKKLKLNKKLKKVKEQN